MGCCCSTALKSRRDAAASRPSTGAAQQQRCLSLPTGRCLNRLSSLLPREASLQRSGVAQTRDEANSAALRWICFGRKKSQSLRAGKISGAHPARSLELLSTCCCVGRAVPQHACSSLSTMQPACSDAPKPCCSGAEKAAAVGSGEPAAAPQQQQQQLPGEEILSSVQSGG